MCNAGITRLDDAEGQIFNVVHEPNKYALEFFYGFYPVPYDVLEAYSQLFYSKSLTLKDKFDEYTITYKMTMHTTNQWKIDMF